MIDQPVPALAQRVIWHCSWNWCPESFRERADLMFHLHATHFNNMLRVKKRDWEAYLRSTEGKSGETDNLSGLQYPSSQSSTSSSVNTNVIQSRTDALTLAHDDTPSTSSLPLSANTTGIPPMPRNVRTRATAAAGSSDQDSSGVAPQTSSYPPTTEGPSPVKRRRKSFATCTAQSSPMSTPSVASVPPSPGLSNMITDAINRSGQLNSQSPHRDNPRRKKPPLNAGPLGTTTVGILPRTTNTGASPTSSQGPSRVLPAIPPPKSPLRSRKSLRTLASPVSVGSAQAVEDALTQTFSKSPSASLSRTGSMVGRIVEQTQTSREPSSLLPSSTQPISQESSEMQPQSYCGSHAVESIPMYTPSGSFQPAETQPSPSQSQSQSQSQASSGPLVLPRTSVRSVVPVPIRPPPTYPPLPRRILRSKTPTGIATPPAAAARPSAANTGVTRTLRSRSKTPAPVPSAAVVPQSQSLPLPGRTRSRSKSIANKNADTGTIRAGSKPPSKRRAGSRQRTSASGAETSGANATGGLAIVFEQTDDSEYRTDTRAPAQLLSTSSAARSGKLQLTRGPHKAVQAQAAQTEVAIKREDAAMTVDPPLALPTAEASVSQSQVQTETLEIGRYSEGFGFDLGGIQLLTQKPYPSQTWGSSQ
ncbi:hypothetical protein C8Q80DRAFT_1151836 [Daedaleopsis nitida]|nr:hypothetical protein C8Q80DRAFT_1151836 [Daedaleopsis nitida]